MKSRSPDRDTLLERAREACLPQKFTTAYQIYDDLLKKYPDDAVVLMDYGRAKFREFTDLEQAAKLFLRVVEVDPDSIDAMLWIALVSWMGYGLDYEQAVSLYRRRLELDPGCVDAYIGLGMLYGSPSAPVSLKEAIDSFHKAVQLAPENTDAHHNLAYVLAEAGETDAAQQEFLRTIQLLQVKRDHLLTQGSNDRVRKVEQLSLSLQVDLEHLRHGEALKKTRMANSG